MSLIAVDPGIRGCGVAAFDTVTDRLVAAAYVSSPVERVVEVVACAVTMAIEVFRWAAPHVPRELVVEWPRVYATRIREGRAGADPNGLLGLAAVDAAISAILDVSTHSHVPSDWKGQMTKEACHARVRSRLDAAELAVLAEAGGGSKGHNVRDAVGVGLHHLGRLKPRRVLPA